MKDFVVQFNDGLGWRNKVLTESLSAGVEAAKGHFANWPDDHCRVTLADGTLLWFQDTGLGTETYLNT